MEPRLNASAEEDTGDWKELRARVDSIANAVFLLAGGALTLSTTFVVNARSSTSIPRGALNLAVASWYWLFGSIALLVALKSLLVVENYLFLVLREWMSRNSKYLNLLGWVLGAAGVIAFLAGLWYSIRAAGALAAA